MKYITLGKSNQFVSRIAFGTWQLGGDWGATDATAAVSAIRQAADSGVNFFDTAQAYGFGASESLLGEALRGLPREELVIATKGGLRRQGEVTVRDASAAWIRAGVDDSLRALSTDYIDLYQVHWPDPKTPFEETAEALAKLVADGKVRHVGVSNFDAVQMEAFSATLPVETLQPPYHLFHREIEREILPYTRAHNIGVVVYGPLAHSLLGGNLRPDTRFASDDWRAQSEDFQGTNYELNLAKVEELKEFARRDLGVTVGQLAVAWTLANPAVHVAIVGTRSPEHVKEMLAAVDLELDSQTLSHIDAIMHDAAPVAGPTQSRCSTRAAR
jgi:aryl-alcohol dehydrogenase-like predicted oxidoreductase